MNFQGLFLLAAALTFSASPLCQAEAPITVRDSNPALIYWQAIGLLSDLGKVENRFPGDVLSGRAPANSPEVETLLSEVRPALKRFKRAANGEAPCVWGITLDEGPYAIQPQLNKMQLLCRLALLNAENAFANGDRKTGMEWVIITHKAARHIGAEPILVNVLTEYTVDGQAIRCAARHLMSLTTEERAAHLQAFENLPPLHDLCFALKGERDMAEWLQRMVLGVENSPGQEAAVLAIVESITNNKNLPAEAEGANQQLKDAVEEWKNTTELIKTVYDRLETACAKPWQEARDEIRAVKADSEGAHPSLLNLFTLLENCLRRQYTLKTQQQMLKAALVLGPNLKVGNLDQFTDAFYAHPFIVRAEQDVFTIAMKEPMAGKEVALRMGLPEGK